MTPCAEKRKATRTQVRPRLLLTAAVTAPPVRPPPCHDPDDFCGPAVTVADGSALSPEERKELRDAGLLTQDCSAFGFPTIECSVFSSVSYCNMAASVVSGMRVIPIPMHSDNYAYLVIDETSNACAVVDPAEHTKALDAAKAAGVEIR